MVFASRALDPAAVRRAPPKNRPTHPNVTLSPYTPASSNCSPTRGFSSVRTFAWDASRASRGPAEPVRPRRRARNTLASDPPRCYHPPANTSPASSRTHARLVLLRARELAESTQERETVQRRHGLEACNPQDLSGSASLLAPRPSSNAGALRDSVVCRQLGLLLQVSNPRFLATTPWPDAASLRHCASSTEPGGTRRFSHPDRPLGQLDVALVILQYLSYYCEHSTRTRFGLLHGAFP